MPCLKITISSTTPLLALLLAFLRGETTHGKLLPKSGVSRSFYLLSADDTYPCTQSHICLCFAYSNLLYCRPYETFSSLFLSIDLKSLKLKPYDWYALGNTKNWFVSEKKKKEKIQSSRLLVEYSKDDACRLLDMINISISFFKATGSIFSFH